MAGAERRASEVLDQAFRLYGPDSVVCSFNGGKDATVVMHLARLALARHCHPSKPTPRLRCCYWVDPSEFPEVRQFVEDCGERYQLDLKMFPSDVSFVRGLEELVSGGARAVIMGTRSSDPHGSTMETFEPSSLSWPPFMRVNPVLRWTYDEIWSFLRDKNLPYCKLYDLGYTSLGNVHNTSRNQHLHDSESGTYQPAHALRDGSLERAGREHKQQSIEAEGSANTGALVG